MGVYVAPVLLLVLALAGQHVRSRKIDTWVLAACTVVIVLIAGLRGDADADYAGYAEMFATTPPVSDFNSGTTAELYGERTYLFLTAVLKSVGIRFEWFVLICATVALLLKSSVATRLARHASLALCLYLCVNFITIEFIQMRWAVATAFLALGFYLQYVNKRLLAVLAYACAAVFHSYAILFWAVAALVTMKGYRRFYVLLGLALIGTAALDSSVFTRYLTIDSDLYALNRLARYVGEPSSHIGVLSIAKLLLYPTIYAACVFLRPSYRWKSDRRNVYLLKLSMISISITLAVTAIPIMHARATVVAEFFAIIWMLNALHIALSGARRIVAFYCLSALFGTWYVIGTLNSIAVGHVLPYRSWL